MAVRASTACVAAPAHDAYVIDSVDEIDKNRAMLEIDTALSSISYTLGARKP